MDSIKRINRDEIEKEKAMKPRSFVKERKDKNERAAPEFDLHIENW
jgi:hypothetical protein